MKWTMVGSLAITHDFELEGDSNVRLRLLCDASDIAERMGTLFGRPTAPHPIDEWHEDNGAVLWWAFPIEEPPYCGTPLDSDWPNYHTHWTPIIVPEQPSN